MLLLVPPNGLLRAGAWAIGAKAAAPSTSFLAMIERFGARARLHVR